jgi:hypothetical protein
VIYIGYQLVCVLFLGGAHSVTASHGILGLVGALAMSVVLQFPIFLSLWRLCFATNTSGPQVSGGAVAQEGRV